MSSTKLKELFEVESKYGAFYTGGNIEWHENTIFCQTPSSISLLNIENGTVSKSIGEENTEDADTIQTFTTNNSKIVTSHKSGLLKLWNMNGEIEKIWKYIHKGPIAKLCIKNDNLASGGSDGVVRLWDLHHQACLSSFKECSGVVNVVEFHPNQELLFASGDDGKVHSYFQSKYAITYSGHFSKVTKLIFTNDLNNFVTSGRDKVIILWQINSKNAIRTIPLYEAVESIIILPNKFELPNFISSDGIYVATGGENGLIRVFDLQTATEIYKQTDSLISRSPTEGGLAITNLIYNENFKAIAIVSIDHNIIVYELKSMIHIKQFVGFSDEILDISYVGTNYLAVATNSNDIKLYESSTMSCQLLKGHSDIVLSLACARSNPNLLISSSKDNQIRVWLIQNDAISCVAIGNRHTGSVGSVAFFQTSTDFAVSASQDTCLKLWEIPAKFTINTPIVQLNCLRTEVAHQKDINCVSVSPNDKIIATASQDKSAKLWNEKLNLIGVLKGHKRGVWCVKFSPIDQVVMTSSADCTIKLWSVTDCTCLKTFEGHESSVLKADFISNGLQIVSAGGDGLIKLFSIKTSECVATLDQHEGRVWALAIKNDESELVSGGSDSFLIKWKDVSEEKKLERLKNQEDMILQEQKLRNFVQNGQLLKALTLALRLNRPLQVLRIIDGIIKNDQLDGLSDVIKQLRDDQKDDLLKCASDWNTNSRNCQSAQVVLNILLKQIQSGDFKPSNLRKAVEEILPYTERHFKRLTQLMQDLNVVTYTINCMQPHAKSSS